MSNYGFTLSGVGLPGGEDPLGLWETPPGDAVSFAAGASAPPVDPTWRIELPGSPEEAQAVLADRIQASELAYKDLESVDRDLFYIGRTETVSFSTSDPLLAQKTDLLATLDAFQSPVSYGLFRKEKEDEDRESRQQWLAFVERVQRMVAHYARIETALAGLKIGQTAVGWTGDFTTTWEPNLTLEMMRAHRQSVHLALGARIALIRIVSVVATGAVGLAVKAAVPGGQVLLLPAVWKFVRDVLAELRQSWPLLEHL